MPDFSFEQNCHYERVAGVDEAGCGPWAGPVVASAVTFFEYDEKLWMNLNDSKKLSKTRREQCYDDITNSKKLNYSVGMASVQEIDQLNIAKATCLAMERAILALCEKPDYVLIDGIRKPQIDIPVKLIIKGDSISLSIAAASIVAKVTRDRMMTEIGEMHPEYGWAKNAGYGTSFHQQALQCYGVTSHHRASFAPIRKLLDEAA
ncbi:MAG: ribonuclease HII [Proteobacteria bacterium]|nr:ribonuclease HII [Pseudomonadota bacterium]